MARDQDDTVQVQQRRNSEKASSVTSGTRTGYGPQVTSAEDTVTQRQQPMPTLTRAELPSESNIVKPTPENYLQENPTVLPFIKKNPRRAGQLERNAFCRWVGGSGLWYAHRHRTWVMGCAAFLSFVCLLLMVVPLIATVTNPDVVRIFSLVNGEAHWQLLAPVDWTERMYLGIGGMVNVTHQQNAYYVPYTARECTEVFGSACNNCHGAGITVVAFIAIAIAAQTFALILDVHRVFVFFDYNLSKVLALILHLVFGVIFTVLAYITFLSKCFMSLPAEAIHNGKGKQGVGIYLVWQLAAVSHVMLALLIIKPIPGILHLITPTPSWANNKGIKAARNQKRGKNGVMDPFDDIANNVLPSANAEKTYANRAAPAPAYAVPIRAQSEAVDEQNERRVNPTMRKPSDADSVGSERNYGELISNFGAAPSIAPTMRAAGEDDERVRRDSARSVATGEGDSLPSSPGRERADSFVDPFASARKASETPAAPAVNEATGAAEEKDTGKKTKKTKKGH